MADIDLRCPECSQAVTVSEFVDPTSLTCRKCGASLQVPETVKPKPKPLPRRADEETEPEPEPKPGKRVKPAAQRGNVRRQQAKRYSTGSVNVSQNATLAWIIFVILGGGMGYLRYGGSSAGLVLGYSGEYAAVIMLGFHCLIVIKAFAESVFQGVLCLLVPFYSLYYIFMVADDFLMRAVFGGLLVGLGQDWAEVVQGHLATTVHAISDWFESGGG